MDAGFFEPARDAGFLVVDGGFAEAREAGFALAARDAGLAEPARDALEAGFAPAALLAGLPAALEAGLAYARVSDWAATAGGPQPQRAPS